MPTKNAYSLEELSKLTTTELMEIHEVTIEVIKMKRDLESRIKATQFKKGDEVTINSPKCKGNTYIIEKLNPKKAVVSNKEKKFETWNVPYNMLEKVK